jgi:glycosyltransferase involved in cell wall biosynthesis
MVRPSSAAGAWLLPLYQRTLYRRFLHGAAQVICLTDAMARRVAEAWGVPPERLSVVPNGVDLHTFPSGEFADRAAGELLFVGRLTAQKNVALLVEAMAALPGDVRLTLVGDGELHEPLRRRIDELGLRNVRLAGRMEPGELAERYRRATAVVMPSTHEGFPLVLLEALSAGAPVVCSALPELIEAGGDAVVPVTPLTADRMAEVLRRLLADAAGRERLSGIARQRAAGFGWPAVATAVEDVYRRVGVPC